MKKPEIKKVRVVLEGMGYKTEEGIVLLATKPTKTVSIEFITENSKEQEASHEAT